MKEFHLKQFIYFDFSHEQNLVYHITVTFTFCCTWEALCTYLYVFGLQESKSLKNGGKCYQS